MILGLVDKIEQKIVKNQNGKEFTDFIYILKINHGCVYFTSSLLDFKDKPFSNNLLKLESSEHRSVKKQQNIMSIDGV